jgi:dTDP-4-amino-4,6-dideoxy-D-galactose acyltransferase
MQVAAIELIEDDSLANIEEALTNRSFDCCYVFCDYPSSPACHQLLTAMGGQCCDHKVTYCKKLISDSPKTTSLANIEIVSCSEPAILDLAVQSGLCSRFRRDPRLRHKQPELYRIWLDKCLNSEHAAVIVLRQDGLAIAMVCVSVNDDCGKIQLIAVAEDCRGRGLGKQLMENAEAFFQKHNCTTAEVVTQLDNVAACKLYEHAGYHKAEIREVWHVWKS